MYKNIGPASKKCADLLIVAPMPGATLDGFLEEAIALAERNPKMQVCGAFGGVTITVKNGSSYEETHAFCKKAKPGEIVRPILRKEELPAVADLVAA